LKEEVLNFQIPPLERSPSASREAASIESKMATMQHKIFWVREFSKPESATAVRRAFGLRFNIHRWYVNI